MVHGAPVDDSPPCRRGLVGEWKRLIPTKHIFQKNEKNIFFKKTKKFVGGFLSPLNDFEFIWLPLYIVEGKRKKKRMGDDIFWWEERERNHWGFRFRR